MAWAAGETIVALQYCFTKPLRLPGPGQARPSCLGVQPWTTLHYLWISSQDTQTEGSGQAQPPSASFLRCASWRAGVIGETENAQPHFRPVELERRRR